MMTNQSVERVMNGAAQFNGKQSLQANYVINDDGDGMLAAVRRRNAQELTRLSEKFPALAQAAMQGPRAFHQVLHAWEQRHKATRTRTAPPRTRQARRRRPGGHLAAPATGAPSWKL